MKAEESSLQKKFDDLVEKHARAVAELDETEDENLKLICALRDIKRTVAEVKSSEKQFMEVSSKIMNIVSKHL